MEQSCNISFVPGEYSQTWTLFKFMQKFKELSYILNLQPALFLH